jgi:hypothetical protein
MRGPLSIFRYIIDVKALVVVGGCRKGNIESIGRYGRTAEYHAPRTVEVFNMDRDSIGSFEDLRVHNHACTPHASPNFELTQSSLYGGLLHMQAYTLGHSTCESDDVPTLTRKQGTGNAQRE